jgi:hypothetical protein
MLVTEEVSGKTIDVATSVGGLPLTATRATTFAALTAGIDEPWSVPSALPDGFGGDEIAASAMPPTVMNATTAKTMRAGPRRGRFGISGVGAASTGSGVLFPEPITDPSVVSFIVIVIGGAAYRCVWFRSERGPWPPGCSAGPGAAVA